MNEAEKNSKEASAALLRFREKRKWQIALRRYILEKNKSFFYAPYFGLDIKSFRNWIEIQFDADLNWSNFSLEWQFDHIVPVAYFDFTKEEDLKLCWNFINIRVEKNDLNKKRGNRVDVLAAKGYFEIIYEKTQYSICSLMVAKINQIELSQIKSNHLLENFINSNKTFLEEISSFTAYEYDKLNSGFSLKEVLAEKELLKKFGGL